MAQGAHHTYGLDGVAAKFKEIVQRADWRRKSENTLHRVSHFPLLFGGWFNVFVGAGNDRFGQRLAVHLSVGGKRHFVELHEDAWHHVVSQGLRHEG